MINECPKLSIIVPVYKAEELLPKCIESILHQTFTDFELLLIDDGSPGKSPSICDEYAEKDSRIIVVHKENGGVSSARNYGMDIAKGEYIGFVDCDDWIEPTMFEKIMNCMNTSGSALGMCGYRSFDKKGKIIVSFENKGILQVDAKEVLYLMFENPSPIRRIVLNKFFKKETLGSMRFDDSVAYGEDVVFLYNYLKKLDKIDYVTENLYNSLVREESASHRGATIEAAMRSIDIQIDVMNDVKKCYPEAFVHVFACLSDVWLFKLMYYMQICVEDGLTEKKKIVKEKAKHVLKYYGKVLSNKEIPIKFKIIWPIRIFQVLLK